MTNAQTGPTHTVKADHFAALAAGGGDEEAIDALWQCERSWRLLALRDLVDLSAERDEPMGPLPSVDTAWDLLTRAEAAEPTAVEDVLAQPSVGIWAAHTLRRLIKDDETDPPLWADVGYLHAVAAACASRAGLSFELAVPVRHGVAMLPTVGAASLPPDASHACVRVDDGSLTVEAAGVSVRASAEDPAWHEPIRIATTAQGVRLRVELLDRDVFRDLRKPSPPRPVTDDEIGRWQDTLDQAWRLLVREQRGRAQAIAATIRTLSVLPGRERFRPLSASGAEAFGGLLLSEQDEATQLAVTLVHESQHQKLGALLHLFTFAGADSRTRYYAPWRDDPRPLGGVLQGVYAFAGITDFWRVHRRFDHHGAQALADFEFALWRRQTRHVVRMLSRSDLLTDRGRAFVDTLRHTIATWQNEPVAEATLTIAERMALDHYALWRANNVVVAPEVAAGLAAAWRRGEPLPGDLLVAADTNRVVRPHPARGGFDTRAVLVRHLLADASSTDRLRLAPGTVAGATPADVALVAGDPGRARVGYLAGLGHDPRDVNAWTGLGLTWPDASDEPARRALLHRPELVIAAARGHAAHTEARELDPVALANWVGNSLTVATLDDEATAAWRLESSED